MKMMKKLVVVGLLIIGVTLVAAPDVQPYADVDWDHVIVLQGSTHMHFDAARKIKRIIDDGMDFLTISNYYPNVPCYPLRERKKDEFMYSQTYPMVKNGELVQGPFYFNEIITEWQDKLPEKTRAKLPFKKPSEPLFPYPIPEDLLEAPNAENSGFTDAPCHIVSPGSTFGIGNFDRRDEFGMKKFGTYSTRCAIPWRKAFKLMFEGLIVPDGGGVIIAHPQDRFNANEPLKQVWLDMLDFDERVLGIEIYNYNIGLAGGMNRPELAYDGIAIWDRILTTGRRCWGFCVPDHKWNWRGRSIILAKERTVAAALQAYRKGNFYGAITGKGVRFKSIIFKDDTLTVTTDRPAKIQIFAAPGCVAEVNGTELVYRFDTEQKRALKFLRAEAADDSGERLFGQPFMLIPPPAK